MERDGGYSKKMKVSLIIPIYIMDRELINLTDRCLTSILNTTPPDTELIIVNDGSPERYNPNVGTVIKRKENGGYSKAVNDGLRACTGDIIVIGNNDLVFPEKWLTGLLNVLGQGFDIATCWTSDQNYQLSNTIEKRAKFGSIFAMTKDTFRQIGYFDEQFRGYFADLDYRERALEMGKRIGKNNNLVIEHLAKATYTKSDPLDLEFETAKRLFEMKHGYIA